MLIRKMILREPENGGIPAASGGSSAPAPSPAPAAPSPAPASAAPAASSPSSSSSSVDRPGVIEDFDFASLVDDAPVGGAAEPSPAAAPPTPAPSTPMPAPAPAVAPPAPAPAAAPPTPAEPAQPPQAPATAQQPASGEQAPTAPQPVDWEKHRATFIPKLQEMYQLSDDEVREFQENPKVALPKLAAEMHYKVQMATHAAIMQLLPAMIGNTLQIRENSVKYEKAFYDTWPALKAKVAADPKFEASINEALRSFKALNPKASVDEVIKKAGMLVMISNGIQPDVPGATAAPVVVPAPAPAAAPLIPGRPAGTGTAPPVPAARSSAAAEDDASFFAGLADHYANGGG